MRRIAVLQTVLDILGAINGAAIQGQQSGEGTVMDWTHIPSTLTGMDPRVLSGMDPRSARPRVAAQVHPRSPQGGTCGPPWMNREG
jgi:hypothetical protein